MLLLYHFRFPFRFDLRSPLVGVYTILCLIYPLSLPLLFVCTLILPSFLGFTPPPSCCCTITHSHFTTPTPDLHIHIHTVPSHIFSVRPHPQDEHARRALHTHTPLPSCFLRLTLNDPHLTSYDDTDENYFTAGYGLTNSSLSISLSTSVSVLAFAFYSEFLIPHYTFGFRFLLTSSRSELES